MASDRRGLSQSYGGIIDLAVFISEHSGAIEYDLLVKTGHELADVGRTLSWGALASFITHEETGSALSRELSGEYALWTEPIKTNGILADIFDMLAQINANLVAIGEHSKAKPVRPYPRPGITEQRDDIKHYGRGALPKDELMAWFTRKREEHYGRNA